MSQVPTKIATYSATTFLSLYHRQAFSITGDGNCLFRCFSFFLFGSQDRHLQVRSLLTEFMTLNPSHFTAYCHPSTVRDHVCRMKLNYVWGTHAEIRAMALCFNIAVYVALQKSVDGEYYWVKYSASEETLNQLVKSTLPADHELPSGHIEIHNVNSHFDIILDDRSAAFPATPPYTGDCSSSSSNTDSSRPISLC